MQDIKDMYDFHFQNISNTVKILFAIPSFKSPVVNLAKHTENNSILASEENLSKNK